MVGGAHAGLIRKVDGGAHLSWPWRVSQGTRAPSSGAPAPGLVRRPARADAGARVPSPAEYCPPAAHCRSRRTSPQITYDRPCPQREIELKLARILTQNHPTKLTFLSIRQSRRAPGYLLHLQRIRPLLPARLQSPENRGPPDHEKPGGVLRSIPLSIGSQRQCPHIFQRPPRDTLRALSHAQSIS